MKVCPLCGGSYPVAEGYCPMDGARLSDPTPSSPEAECDEAEAWVGQVLDRRYRLDEVIGRGGMGFVLRATHTLIGKAVAVKVLRAEHIHDFEVVSRFLLEARVASSIKHPNVVDISDYGELPSGGAFYVMEFLRGRTLADRIDHDGPLSPQEAVTVALQVCHGLSAAHAQGVIHRDLKPENVFLCGATGTVEPRVKLLDFGIARAESAERITVAGAVLGTPEYMSPEQATGAKIDARSDLYGLGIILFEMLTGLVPFRSDDIAVTIESHISAPPPAIGDVVPALAGMQCVSAFVQASLAKTPDQRPESAEAATAQLEAALRADLGEDGGSVERSTRPLGSGAQPPGEGAHLTPPRSDAPAAEPRVEVTRAQSPRRPTERIGPPSGSVLLKTVVSTAFIAAAITFTVYSLVAELLPGQDGDALVPAHAPVAVPVPAPEQPTPRATPRPDAGLRARSHGDAESPILPTAAVNAPLKGGPGVAPPSIETPKPVERPKPVRVHPEVPPAPPAPTGTAGTATKPKSKPRKKPEAEVPSPALNPSEPPPEPEETATDSGSKAGEYPNSPGDLKDPFSRK